MNITQATLSLIEALSHIGYSREDFEITKKDNDVIVALVPPRNYGAIVTITIGEFWAYPGIACYFVNYTWQDSFTACSGTPHLHRALFDLGGAIEAFNTKKLREQL